LNMEVWWVEIGGGKKRFLLILLFSQLQRCPINSRHHKTKQKRQLTESKNKSKGLEATVGRVQRVVRKNEGRACLLLVVVVLVGLFSSASSSPLTYTTHFYSSSSNHNHSSRSSSSSLSLMCEQCDCEKFVRQGKPEELCDIPKALAG
jgi:hypothetical protein